MSDVAQSPETIAGLVPEVRPGGKSRRTEAVEPESARDEAIPRREEAFAPGPRKFPVGNPDAHLAV